MGTSFIPWSICSRSKHGDLGWTAALLRLVLFSSAGLQLSISAPSTDWLSSSMRVSLTEDSVPLSTVNRPLSKQIIEVKKMCGALELCHCDEIKVEINQLLYRKNSCSNHFYHFFLKHDLSLHSSSWHCPFETFWFARWPVWASWPTSWQSVDDTQDECGAGVLFSQPTSWQKPHLG